MAMAGRPPGRSPIGARSCVLALRRDADARLAVAVSWARQKIALEGRTLRLTLAVENLGRDDMPCGLGFHPFLPRGDGVAARFQATQVWDGTAGAFPTEHVAIGARARLPRRAARRRAAGHRSLLRGLAGSRDVTPRRAARGSAGRQPGDALLIVYVPAGADYFCVEPVTHAVNAMNLPDATDGGLWRLAPRENGGSR